MDDAQEGLVEVFDEMEGQLDKEVARLEALKKVRLEDPGELDCLIVAREADVKTLSTLSITTQIWRAWTSLQTPRRTPVNSRGTLLRRLLPFLNRPGSLGELLCRWM